MCARFRLDVWPLAERIHNDWENLDSLKECLGPRFVGILRICCMSGEALLTCEPAASISDQTAEFGLIPVGEEPSDNAYW